MRRLMQAVWCQWAEYAHTTLVKTIRFAVLVAISSKRQRFLQVHRLFYGWFRACAQAHLDYDRVQATTDHAKNLDTCTILARVYPECSVENSSSFARLCVLEIARFRKASKPLGPVFSAWILLSRNYRCLLRRRQFADNCAHRHRRVLSLELFAGWRVWSLDRYQLRCTLSKARHRLAHAKALRVLSTWRLQIYTIHRAQKDHLAAFHLSREQLHGAEKAQLLQDHGDVVALAHAELHALSAITQEKTSTIRECRRRICLLMVSQRRSVLVASIFDSWKQWAHVLLLRHVVANRVVLKAVAARIRVTFRLWEQFRWDSRHLYQLQGQLNSRLRRKLTKRSFFHWKSWSLGSIETTSVTQCQHRIVQMAQALNHKSGMRRRWMSWRQWLGRTKWAMMLVQRAEFQYLRNNLNRWRCFVVQEHCQVRDKRFERLQSSLWKTICRRHAACAFNGWSYIAHMSRQAFHTMQTARQRQALAAWSEFLEHSRRHTVSTQRAIAMSIKLLLRHALFTWSRHASAQLLFLAASVQRQKTQTRQAWIAWVNEKRSVQRQVCQGALSTSMAIVQQLVTVRNQSVEIQFRNYHRRLLSSLLDIWRDWYQARAHCFRTITAVKTRLRQRRTAIIFSKWLRLVLVSQVYEHQQAAKIVRDELTGEQILNKTLLSRERFASAAACFAAPGGFASYTQ